MEKLEDLNLLNLKIYQDDSLYRFTSDSVMLSRFATVKPHDTVADFCSGSGIVGFHLYGLHPKIDSVSLFELQTPLYKLSEKSIEYNGLREKFFAHNIKVQDAYRDFNGKFSLIVCNPPYQRAGEGKTADSDTIRVCKTEIELTLDELVESFSKCLKFGGRVALCNKAERLTEVIVSMKKFGIEPKRLQFVSVKGKTPYLFMIEGVKGGKTGLKVLPEAYNDRSSI